MYIYNYINQEELRFFCLNYKFHKAKPEPALFELYPQYLVHTELNTE